MAHFLKSGYFFLQWPEPIKRLRHQIILIQKFLTLCFSFNILKLVLIFSLTFFTDEKRC